nr:hypothetical protein [uncultured Dethiosulfovibrio sp.]
MSGPKRTSWSIAAEQRRRIEERNRETARKRKQEYEDRVARRERERQKQIAKRHEEYLEREARRQERAQIREGKETDLATAIKECRITLRSITKEFGEKAFDISRVEEWLSSAEMNIKGDIREGWREVNGARNFLQKREEMLRKRPAPPEPSQAELVLKDLEELLSETPEITNPGITQRVNLIKGSLKVNKENPATLGEVQKLFSKINEMVEEYEIKKQEQRFVIETFAEIIGGVPPTPKSGQSSAIVTGREQNAQSSSKGASGTGGPQAPESFSGTIGGMPVTVTLSPNSNEIQLHTPEKGDCKTPLKLLKEKLAEKGVNLGAIRIAKTGENWNPVSTSANNVQSKQIKA